MRLAFATAIATKPEILLIDEVLAVGDEGFQRKCHDKINEFKKERKTILFVSHSLGTVKELCDRSILLDHGVIDSMGSSEKVIDHYREKIRAREEISLKKQQDKLNKQQDAPQRSAKEEAKEIKPPDRWGSGEIEITEVNFLSIKGEDKHIFETGEPMIVRMKYFAKEKIEKPVFGIAIHRNDGVHITGPNTRFDDNVIESIEGEGFVEYAIEALPLLKGTYLFSAAVYDYECKKPYDHHEKKYTFRINDGKYKEFGIFHIPCKWKYYQ